MQQTNDGLMQGVKQGFDVAWWVFVRQRSIERCFNGKCGSSDAVSAEGCGDTLQAMGEAACFLKVVGA